MFPSSSSSQELLLSYYNRRLLQHSPLYHPPHEFAATPPFSAPTSQIDAATPDRYIKPNNGFDANIIMVIFVLLCALFCSLGLNSIIRCAQKCSNFVARNSAHGNSDGNDDGRNNNRTSSTTLANTGLRKKALKTFPTVSYSSDLKLPGLDTECVICLSDFVPAERIRLLPKCNHGFHVRCIDKWLTSHSSCPTCRNCLVETCQKIVGCNQASSSEPPLPSPPPPPPPPPSVSLVQEIIVNVAPLEREDMLHSN